MKTLNLKNLKKPVLLYNKSVIWPGYPQLSDKRAIGMYIHGGKHELKHPDAMFPYITNKNALHKYILNRIRPTGNNFKDV